LLEDGCNPNVKDNAGWTPMVLILINKVFYSYVIKTMIIQFNLKHEAVKSGNLNIVKELIKYGAHLNVPGFEYESPLYTAIKYGKFEIAKSILNYGADVNFINIYGDSVR